MLYRVVAYEYVDILYTEKYSKTACSDIMRQDVILFAQSVTPNLPYRRSKFCPKYWERSGTGVAKGKDRSRVRARIVPTFPCFLPG